MSLFPRKTGSRTVSVALFTVISLVFLRPEMSCAKAPEEPWPRRVLITNDDGIDNFRIIALARAFSKLAETYVVAPLEDRSSSGNFTTVNKRKELMVKRREFGEGIEAFGVDGYPADCVILALTGIMRDRPPDLVISGINRGPNLGQDWLGSGTIGAARMAAFGGVPAIAVSGLKREIPGSLEAATRWVVEFAQSPMVRGLQPSQYLTVSIPRIAPNAIKGMRIATRAGLRHRPVLNRIVQGQNDSQREIWRVEGSEKLEGADTGETDISLFEQGYIVVVPMRADEHDYEMLKRWKNREGPVSPYRLPPRVH